ncbi:NAD(P)/FAD-dependent oxidoreductase, partial [Pseudomonas otitidis]
PTDMKAAPLLRAWLKRLRELGVQVHTRHRWLGWAEGGTDFFHRLVGQQVEVHRGLAIPVDALADRGRQGI